MNFTRNLFFIFFFLFFASFVEAKVPSKYDGWKQKAVSYLISNMGPSQAKKYATKKQERAKLEARWDRMFKAFQKVWGEEELWKQKVAISVCIKETWCGLTTPLTKWGSWERENDNGSLDCGLTQINQGSTEHSCEALNASDVLAFEEQKRILEIKVLDKKTIMVDDMSKPRLERCAKKDLDLKAPKVERERKKWAYGMRWRRVNGKKVKKRVKTKLETFKRWEYQCRYPQKWVTPRRVNTLQTWLNHVWRYNGGRSYGPKVKEIYNIF